MNKQRKTSHILNVFQYDETTGAVTLPSTLVLTAPASNDNSTKVPTTAWVRTYVTGLSYLTGNQSITVSGDATGSGTTAITLTLANTAVTPGIYGSATLVPVVTVDSKGRITSVTTAAISGSLTFTGDVTGSGTTGTSTAMTLAASGVTAGTYTKVTVDSKGRVTVGASATTSDISEGTNLYYTDARVLAYLSANTYATQSYVNTQVSNLVAAAPATLDTLNELAAALGNDPSFATTISTALGNRLRVDINTQGLSATLQGYGRTNLGLGTAATSNTGDFVAYRTFGTAANSAVGDFVAYRTFGTAANNNTGDFATAAQGTKADTAFGWGNHASAGYLTSALAATTYASLTGAYANPAFVASLAYSKITGVPAFLTSYTETDPYRVTTVAVSGTSTKTITLTRADASTVTTTWTDIDTDTNTYVTSAGFSGGNLTLTRNDTGQITVSLDGRYYLATNPSGYITGITSGNVTTALGFTPYNATNPSGYISSYTETDTLASVTGRGNSTATASIFSSSLAVGNSSHYDSAQFSLDVNGGVLIKNTGKTAQLILQNANPAVGGNNGFVQHLVGGTTTGAFASIQTYYGTSVAAGTLQLQPNGGSVTIGGSTVYHGGNLPTIPTNTNQLTNGAGYITSSSSISGNAGSVTYLMNRTDAAAYPVLWGANYTNSIGTIAYSCAAVTIQSSTGTLSATTFSGALSGTASGNVLARGQSNWSGSGVIDNAVGLLAWKNYNNSHVIFDASNGTSPSGTGVSQTNATNAWTAAYPTLMGWNGAGTYGVRVDSARVADSASSVAWTNVSGRPTAVSSFTNDSGYLASVGLANMTDVHRLFNNMGNAHGTYQDFNSVGNFGVRYMQGSTNGPQSGQFYGFTLGLGNDYGYGTYGSQFYWMRNQSTPYIWIRFQEGGSQGSWNKISAGYADSAGSAPANGGTSSNTNSISNALGNTHTWTGGQNNFLGNGNTGGTNNVGMVIYSLSGNGAQFSFHRSSAYAINMGLDSDNVIRIGGWSASPNRFQMDMSGNLTMAGDITAYSDARVKENIATIENALNKVLALRGVSYNRIDSDDKKTKIGVIAQETLPIVPEVVNQDNDGMYNVSYGNLAGLFIEAIKEQQKEIEELKTLIYGITR